MPEPAVRSQSSAVSGQRPSNQQTNKPAHSPHSILLLPLFIYTLLTLALTWPLMANLRSAVPNDIGDPLLNTWILAWNTHALLTNPLNLFNANIFHPLPQTLAYSEHLFSTALLALPLQLATAEPVAAYNLSLLLAFVLSAFGMYLLAFHWTGSRSAAFIAGLMFGFAPYRLAAIAHLQLLTFQWLPFALLFLDKAMSGRRSAVSHRRRDFFLCGFFLWLQLLASWYLAVYTGLILAVFLLGEVTAGKLQIAGSKSRHTQPATRNRWVGLATTLLLVFATTLPFALPYVVLLDDLHAARPIELALSLAATPTDYAAAAPFNRVFGPLTAAFRARPGFTEENTLFLGLVALLLAAMALALALKATAPRLRKEANMGIRGYTLQTSWPAVGFALLLILAVSLLLTFPGPYNLLAQLLPPSTVIRVPPRWVIPALFALAGLAAFGLTTLQRHLKFTVHHAPFIILTALLLTESLSTPIPLAEATPRTGQPPAYHWLAARPDAAALGLIELPLHSAPAPEYPEVKRLTASTLGWWRLVNGYSGYTPPRQPELAAALQNFPDDDSIAALQNLADQHSALSPQSSPFYVLVHPGEAPLDRSRWEESDRWQAEASPALLPVGEFAGDALYRVLPSRFTHFGSSPLALFGADRGIELLDITLLPPLEAGQPPALSLYWRAAAPVADAVTVFVHLRAGDGFVRSQADGPPVRGHIPAPAWTPGQVVQDIHPMPPGEDLDTIDHLAIGLYYPNTGERLPAVDAAGRPLPDNALIIPLN